MEDECQMLNFKKEVLDLKDLKDTELFSGEGWKILAGVEGAYCAESHTESIFPSFQSVILIIVGCLMEPGQEMGTALCKSQIYPRRGGRTHPST